MKLLVLDKRAWEHELSDLLEQITQLRTEKNASVRNALALNLAGTGDGRVLDALVDLIRLPELANERGTHVNCLGSFKYEKLFELLVELQMFGNWEVAHEAHSLILNIEFVGGEAAEAGYARLVERSKEQGVESWRLEQIAMIIKMFE